MSDYHSWSHSKSIPVLIRKADKDSDPVSMFTDGPDAELLEDLAVVILQGNAVIRMFREWAVRNKILTEDDT